METSVTASPTEPVPQGTPAGPLQTHATPKWGERVAALKNIPPVLRMVWEAAPGVITSSIVCRVLVALIPLAALAVTRVIVNDIVDFRAQGGSLPHNFWCWWAWNSHWPSGGGILVRLVNFSEIVLADRYSKHISTKIMEHASRLDLTSFEDPLFYDKMERARVQRHRPHCHDSIDRPVDPASGDHDESCGRHYFLVAMDSGGSGGCVIPAFLGETHFAFMGYSLNFKQTPAKREMDYLRIVGGSKESAKELKLFGLASYLVNRYTKLSNELHAQNVGLAKRRMWVGAAFTLLGALGITEAMPS